MAVRQQAGIDSKEPLDLGYGLQRGLADKLALLLTGALEITAEAKMPIPEALAPITRMLATLVALQRGGVQARLPYDLEIQ